MRPFKGKQGDNYCTDASDLKRHIPKLSSSDAHPPCGGINPPEFLRSNTKFSYCVNALPFWAINSGLKVQMHPYT